MCDRPNFWKDFGNICKEFSYGEIDMYNRGMMTIEETIATILDRKRQDDIQKFLEKYGEERFNG